jgi:hypothetical protein
VWLTWSSNCWHSAQKLTFALTTYNSQKIFVTGHMCVKPALVQGPRLCVNQDKKRRLHLHAVSPQVLHIHKLQVAIIPRISL